MADRGTSLRSSEAQCSRVTALQNTRNLMDHKWQISCLKFWYKKEFRVHQNLVRLAKRNDDLMGNSDGTEMMCVGLDFLPPQQVPCTLQNHPPLRSWMRTPRYLCDSAAHQYHFGPRPKAQRVTPLHTQYATIAYGVHPSCLVLT